MKKHFKAKLLLCFLSYYTICTAQEGIHFEQADLSFPRTLMDATELDQIRERLSEELYAQLFSGSWNYALKAIPADNLTDQSRRMRAQLAREAAFVLLLKTKIQNGVVTSFTVEDTTGTCLLVKLLRLFDEMNTEVGYQAGWSFYYEWQFRSKELIHWLIAYDLLKGAGVSDDQLKTARSNLKQFAGNLYRRAMAGYPIPIPGFPDLDFFRYNINNHGIMVGAALGLAGLVLYDENDPAIKAVTGQWLNAGMWNIDNTLWREDGIIPRVSEPGKLAGYAEGPAYFNYCFVNAFPFLRALWNILPDGNYPFTFRGNTRTIRHPWYDPNYHNLYDWMIRLRMPNGHLPSIHDSPTSFQSQITALSGIEKYNVGVNAQNLNNIWLRSQYISTLQAKGNYPETLFQALPDAGSLVFRSSWDDPRGIYMHLIGKNGIPLYGAKAHHQADATGFQLYFNGEILALDAGYPGAPFRRKSSSATSHNLILVDGKGPREPLSEWVSDDNNVHIEHYFDCPRLDYGELQGNWQGADVKRKVLFIDHKYFVMADFLSSDQEVSFQFQLHGRGLFGAEKESQEGAFLPDFSNHRGVFSTKNSNLLAFITATGGVDEYRHQKDSVAIGTNAFRAHSKILAEKKAVLSTEFLSLLYPFAEENAPPVIEKFPDHERYSAVKIRNEKGWDYVIVQKDTTLSSLSGTNEIDLEVNGTINLLSITGHNDYQYFFIKEGDYVALDGIPQMKADKKVDLYVEKNENGSLAGFINRPATVQIFSAVPLVAKTGPIANTNYDPVNRIATITFWDAGNFNLQIGEARILSSQKDLFGAGITEIKLLPNPVYEQSSLVFYSERNTSLKISLFTLTGRLIEQRTVEVKSGSNRHLLDLNHLPASIYLLHLEKEGHTHYTKIVKK